MPITQLEATALLKRWQAAYDAGDATFFDFFASDATFFTLSSVTRIDGLEEFRRGFEPLFGQGEKRRSQILSPDFQLPGDAALVTYHNRIFINGRVSNLRSSIVITRNPQGELKITHLHNSPLQTAKVTPGPGSTPESIDLLEERVATAAATVGTPK